ncbi:MAG TPA: hypothetical protein VMJ93_00285 [Verrucomicrobiae bacterium]|nr:hypothetical protein [Verrucomicrobiae bacterium]
MIPPISLHLPDGRTLRAWDFKQKKYLIIAFLDSGCDACADFLRRLVAHAPELREKNAVVLIAFLEAPPPVLTEALPAGIFAGADYSGRGARAFLGRDALSPSGLQRRGVFAADRYGELFTQWILAGHEFPPAGEIFSALAEMEIACEECG